MAQRHSGLSERSNLVVSVSTEVETGTTSSPPQKIKVVVCFTSIPPLGTRFSRPLRGGVTTRLVDQPEHKTQGGSVIAERAGLIELTCSGAKLGLRGCESAYTQSRTQNIFGVRLNLVKKR